MKNRINLGWLVLLTKSMVFLLIFGGIISNSFAQDREYLEGFYGVNRSDLKIFVLNFNKDGTVIVTEKKSSDKDTKELQRYELVGDNLTIKPIWNTSQVTAFNDVTLTKSGKDVFTFSKDGLDYVVEKHSNWPGILRAIALLIGLIIFNHLCRWSWWFVLASCVILPIYLTIYVWPITTDGTAVNTWFHVAKVWSVLAGSVFATVFRFTKLRNYKWAKFTIAAILCINIAEAVLRDFELGTKFGGSYHFINATAGILCILTVSGWLTIKADNSRYKDMVWPDMTLLWIIAYDVWNWSFICNAAPEHAVMGFMVLSSATIPAFYKVGLWLQARFFTLSAYMMFVMAGARWVSNPLTNVLLPDNPAFYIVVALISLGLNGYNAYIHFGMMIKRRAWGFGQPVLTSEEHIEMESKNKPFPAFVKLA